MTSIGEQSEYTGAGSSDSEPALDRLSTGNPRADEILGGGFPTNTINLLIGQPGTGKTLFAQQLVFHNASDDRRLVYLTTMSEPLSKVVRFLQTYAFFDESKVGGNVMYEDLGPQLNREGPAAIVEAISTAIRTHRPKIIVIDSFKVIRDLVPSIDQMRRLMYQLAGVLSAYQVTSFLIGEYERTMSQQSPEFSVADCIMEFLRETEEPQQSRYIRIMKLRGCAYHEGLHAITLSSRGVRVYPRLVTPASPTGYQVYDRRVRIGCPPLDEMLGGGIWQGNTTMVSGPTGAGKTTLGLQFAAGGLQDRERALYVNFQENPTQLRRRIATMMPSLGKDAAQQFHTKYYSPVELPADCIIGDVFETIENNRVQRVVFDAIGDLYHMTTDLARLQDYVYALCEYFAVHGITAMLLMESQLVGTASSPAISRLSQMASNVILLETEYGDETRRYLRVVKTRNSAHASRRRRYTISEKGLELEQRH